MRISDWSSDVCSSDLLHPTLHLLSGGYSGCELLAENLDDGEGAVEQLPHHSPQGHHRLQSGRTDQALCPMLPSTRLRSRTLLVQTQLSPGVTNGRAQVRTPVTNSPIVCSLLLEKKKKKYTGTD